MTSTVGIPSTRISSQFIRQRLLAQTQYDQISLFKLETQLSTGHRFQTPGEDPISALQVISIQSLLERKNQVRNNLSTNQSFLSTTDAAMASINNILTSVRADSLVALNTTTTSAQRDAISQQVNQAIRQLVDIGNQRFRGRYLFSGSTTQSAPFSLSSQNVVSYSGNEAELLSYADIDLLFQTNIPGSQLFGAISSEVQGATDVNPSLTYNTRLTDLRGGQGIRMGSILISDGMNSTVIDITGAETIGDVAELIRNNPPADRSVEPPAKRTIDIEVTATGLKLRLVPTADPDDSENLIVREVGGGTTAADLGILNKTGVGSNWLVGEDLDPVLLPTTSLNDILGHRAYTVVRPQGDRNDFVVQATAVGEEYNDVHIIFQADPFVTAGNETVTYDTTDPNNKQLIIRIEEGQSRISNVVAAIHKACTDAGLPFDAWLDPIDASKGTSVVIPTPAGESEGTTAGGSGTPFDRDSGIQITNGNQTYTFDFGQAETVEDVLNLLNASPAGLLAQINSTGTGINIRSRLSGCDFAISENGGQTATQLGLRTYTARTKLADLNFGRGIETWDAGEPAFVSFELPGQSSSLTFTATSRGTAWNDVAIQFVAGAPDTASLNYDRYTGTMIFTVDPATTNLRDIAALVAADPEANADFSIQLPEDQFQPTAMQELIDQGILRTAGGDDEGADLTITRADGVKLQVDLQGCTTIEDVINRINNNPDNTPLGTGTTPALVASLATTGNGIVLTDTTGPGEMTVANTLLSKAATDLGWITDGQDHVTVKSEAVPTITLTSVDVNPRETKGVFTALMRLQAALQADDLREVERAMNMLDEGVLNATFVRAELGTRMQSLEVLGQRLDDEDLELQSVLSLEYDSDFVETVSHLAARQAALQASMKATAMIFRMTLLDFL